MEKCSGAKNGWPKYQKRLRDNNIVTPAKAGVYPLTCPFEVIVPGMDSRLRGKDDDWVYCATDDSR
jgi:hypothetical protein